MPVEYGAIYVNYGGVRFEAVVAEDGVTLSSGKSSLFFPSAEFDEFENSMRELMKLRKHRKAGTTSEPRVETPAQADEVPAVRPALVAAITGPTGPTTITLTPASVKALKVGDVFNAEGVAWERRGDRSFYNDQDSRVLTDEDVVSLYGDKMVSVTAAK